MSERPSNDDLVSMAASGKKLIGEFIETIVNMIPLKPETNNQKNEARISQVIAPSTNALS